MRLTRRVVLRLGLSADQVRRLDEEMPGVVLLGWATVRTHDNLSKQEAADRLIVQAVKLQFNDGDPLAIHLLLMSALRICLDVQGSQGTVDEFRKFVKPGKHKNSRQIFIELRRF